MKNTQSNSSENPMRSYESKVVWKGSLLDATCVLAIDSTFARSKEWNKMYFTVTAHNYELSGSIQVKLGNDSWTDHTISYISKLYLEDLMKMRVEDACTIH